MLNRHSKLKESGCPPSVGRLFALLYLQIETRDLIITVSENLAVAHLL